MTARRTTDLVFLAVLASFRLLQPIWLQLLLLAAAVTFFLYLFRNEPLKGRLIRLVGRTLCVGSAWVVPYHAALFSFSAVIFSENVSPLFPVKSGLKERLPQELAIFLGLALVAWLSHVWSTFSLPFNMTFFRPRWIWTVLLFAASYTALDLVLNRQGVSNRHLEVPEPLPALLAGQFLLVWISRVADFQVHAFSHFLLSALFVSAVTTFIFYLTDMITRKDVWKIWLVQYGLFLCAGSRAFVVFLIVFSLFYLFRRARYEQETPAKSSVREYQRYFEHGMIEPVLVPFSIAILFLFSHRNFSQPFLTVFTAAWIPFLADSFRSLSSITVFRKYHDAVARKLPRPLTRFWTSELSFATVTVAGIVLLGLLLVAANRFPWRVLWVYPLIWSLLTGVAAGVRRLGWDLVIRPGIFWSSLASAAGAALIESSFFRS
jgi:hypothetical protein